MRSPAACRLRRLVPQLGNFFTQLKLVDAFREYDAVFALSRRKYISPNFAELRHVVNIAQVGSRPGGGTAAGRVGDVGSCR